MKRWIRYLLCMIVCIGFAWTLSEGASARADGLEVHFMDVGRNDGILIRCGGEDVLSTRAAPSAAERRRRICRAWA